MRNRLSLLFTLPAFMVLVCIGLSSCFTGIENTKTIELSRQDRRKISETPEELFLSDLEGRPLSQWKIGDRFLITDDRIRLILENDRVKSDSVVLAGHHLSFSGTDRRSRPDRSEELILLLSDSTTTYRLPSGMSPEKADSSLLSTRLPMIIDLETVDSVSQRLKGKTLWPRTQLWYTPEGEKKDGRKFVPVNVCDVLPGSTLFPVKIIFTDDSGEKNMMWMNYTSGTADSRRFPTLFSLTDQRSSFRNIDDSTWELIRSGNVAIGMTKEECRLSLGNPGDVDSGHNHSMTMDIWKYPDGTILRFADGRLASFRK